MRIWNNLSVSAPFHIAVLASRERPSESELTEFSCINSPLEQAGILDISGLPIGIILLYVFDSSHQLYPIDHRHFFSFS